MTELVNLCYLEGHATFGKIRRDRRGLRDLQLFTVTRNFLKTVTPFENDNNNANLATRVIHE